MLRQTTLFDSSDVISSPELPGGNTPSNSPDGGGACWTGSCPCQPFSVAGKGEGIEDERHLWPEFFRLIRECRPGVIFGEQVASPDVVGSGIETSFLAAVQNGDNAKANEIAKRIADRNKDAGPLEELSVRWLDGISTDLESEGYSVWAAVVGAHSVGAPHIRQRLYWVAFTGDDSVAGGLANGASGGRGVIGDSAQSRSFGHADGGSEVDIACWTRCECCEDFICNIHGMHAYDCDCPPIDEWASLGIDPYSCGLGEPSLSRLQGHAGHVGNRDEPRRIDADASGPIATTGAWADFTIIPCSDGRLRRVSAKPGDEPLAYGVPSKSSDPMLGRLIARLGGMGRSAKAARRIVATARSNRVGRLRGYGNAIIPELAAVFVRAFMEAMS